MSVGAPATGAGPLPRIAPAAVWAEVRRCVRGAQTNPGSTLPPVLLLRGQPAWSGPAEATVAGRQVRVEPCVSRLAVLEQVTRRSTDGSLLVLITDVDEAGLGDTVLSQVHRQRVTVPQPWTAIQDDFGATRIDPRLVSEDRWVSQALLEARPPAGWPRQAGALLARDTALAELAVARLGLREAGLRSSDLDAAALLRWTMTPGATEAFRRLDADERAGITRWLVERTGEVGRALFALVEAGNGASALALGLVCDCLWARPADAGRHGAAAEAAAVERAKGRVEHHFGEVPLSDASVRAFADAVREVVLTAIGAARPGVSQLGLAPAAGQGSLHPVDEVPTLLDAAERVLDKVDARAAGSTSDILRAGFEHRLTAVGEVVATFVALVDNGLDRSMLAGAAHDIAGAVAALRRHTLADVHRERVERAVMAGRVASWLATQPTGRKRSDGPTTLAGALDAYLADGAWADAALGHPYAGDAAPVAQGLSDAYGALYRTAALRRRELDAAFARQLAVWTRTGRSTGGGPLLVEDVLDRVVAPAILARGGRALLVVLDGMSAAVAVQLAEQLRRDRWQEYDPLGGEAVSAAEAPTDRAAPRRRAAVALLPTITAASRTSLLAGRPVTGDKAKEKSEFENHPRWGKRAARLFHDAELAGEPGAPLSHELVNTLTSDTPLVAVVINTIDDTLDKGTPGDEPGWDLASVGPLRHVLAHARNAGRAVVITSDHGHVLDRDSRQVRGDGAETARYRPAPADGAEPCEGEVLLEGPRVLAPGGRIVALWDAHQRYLGRRGGYHGGASAAEVTVPVLAFGPFQLFADASTDVTPPGWRALPDQWPQWWTARRPGASALDTLGGGDTAVLGGRRPASAAAETALVSRKKRRTADAPAAPALFDLPEDAAAASTGSVPHEAGAAAAGAAADALVESPGGALTELDAFIAALLTSEIFEAQLAGMARRVPAEKIEAALRALLGANGTLATGVVAERAGERPARAGGFAVTLQRLFNIDNYPVLSLIDDGRTLRLDNALLREQFGLPA